MDSCPSYLTKDELRYFPERVEGYLMTDQKCPSCGNLDKREVDKRRKLASFSFVTAFAVVVFNKLSGVEPWMEWLTAIPFFLGYLGLLQAQTQTCVMLAFADRDLSQGQSLPVDDRATGWRLKKRSVKIILAAVVLAVLSAAICAKL